MQRAQGVSATSTHVCYTPSVAVRAYPEACLETSLRTPRHLSRDTLAALSHPGHPPDTVSQDALWESWIRQPDSTCVWGDGIGSQDTSGLSRYPRSHPGSHLSQDRRGHVSQDMGRLGDVTRVSHDTSGVLKLRTVSPDNFKTAHLSWDTRRLLGHASPGRPTARVLGAKRLPGEGSVSQER